MDSELCKILVVVYRACVVDLFGLKIMCGVYYCIICTSPDLLVLSQPYSPLEEFSFTFCQPFCAQQ